MTRNQNKKVNLNINNGWNNKACDRWSLRSLYLRNGTLQSSHYDDVTDDLLHHQLQGSVHVCRCSSWIGRWRRWPNGTMACWVKFWWVHHVKPGNGSADDVNTGVSTGASLHRWSQPLMNSFYFKTCREAASGPPDWLVNVCIDIV